METRILDSVRDTVKNWWTSLILGGLFVIMGIWMMFDPVESYVALVIVFSVLWFISGLMEIVFSVSNRKVLNGWGWTLTGGIIDLLLGIVLMTLPEISLGVVPFIVSFWFMYKGISAIGFSLDLNHMGIKGWGWLLALGVLITILSFILLFSPESAALTLVYVTAFAFLMIGIFRIMLSFELKSVKNKYKDAEDKIEDIAERIEEKLDNLSKRINSKQAE